MPVLTHLNPVTAYTASVTTDGSGNLTNGLGTPLTSINVTASYAQSASFAVTSSISVISQFDISSSYASASSTASYLIEGNTYSVAGLSSSAIILDDLVIKDGIIFPDSLNGDVLVFESDAALVVSSSGGSVAMGNGICFADLGFQTPGLSTQGFFDNSQTPGRVTVWNPAFPALSSSVTTITEVETLHGISSSVKLQTQIDGKQAFLPTASISPSNPSTIAGWVNITVGGNLFWMPLYK